MKFIEREYQEDAIFASLNDLYYDKRSLIVLPTGAGKAYILARIIKEILDNVENFRIIALLDQQNLVEQLAETFGKITGIAPEIACSGINKNFSLSKKLIVGTRQSVYKKINQLGKFDLLIADEAHKWTLPKKGKPVKGQFQELIAHLITNNSNIALLGCTATPYSLQAGYIYGITCKADLVPYFEKITYSASYKMLIKNNYLSKPVFYTNDESPLPDLSSVKISGGEYVNHELGAAMCKYTKAVFEACEKYCKERKHVLIFAVNINHAEKIYNEFPEGNAILVHSQLKDCKQRLADFKLGKYKYCISIDQLSVGFDFRAADAAVLARPTKSVAVFMQQVGRVLRISEETGKNDALIIDLVGNMQHLRNGDLDNPIVAIPKTSKNSDKKDIPTKSCPGYFENGERCTEDAMPLQMRICRTCGYKFSYEELSAVLPELKKVEDGIKRWTVFVDSAQTAVCVSRKNDQSYLKIVFFCNHREVGHDFLFFPEDGYSGGIIGKSYSAWKKLFPSIEYPKSAIEADFFENEIKIPSSLEMKNDGKYNKIEKYVFDKQREEYEKERR